MSAANLLTVSRILLRDLGVTSLNGGDPANQTNPLEDGDLEDVANVITSSLQDIFDDGPSEIAKVSYGGYLRAPTTVTLTATIGSPTVSAVTTYAVWMAGCTIRIAGDDADNELLSSTLLARPFAGTTGSHSATVYADAVTLDETIQHVQSPLFMANTWPLYMAQSLQDFMNIGRFPIVTGVDGVALTATPFYLMSNKIISARPYTWILDSYYNSDLDYLPRRIRFSPMPSGALTFGYTAINNPIRVTAQNIEDAIGNDDDDAMKFPIPNGWVESILIPICRQRLTGLPTFKNEQSKPEIARANGVARNRLLNSRGAGKPIRARYPE